MLGVRYRRVMPEPDRAEPVVGGLRGRSGEPKGEFSRSEESSTYQRLNEFGWNALPTYLAVLGAIFLLFGVFSASLRSAAYAALFIALSILKRRHEGAWFRRY